MEQEVETEDGTEPGDVKMPNAHEVIDTKDNEFEDPSSKQETPVILDTPGNQRTSEDLDVQTDIKNEECDAGNDTNKHADESIKKDVVTTIKTEPEPLESEELVVTGLSDEILRLNPDFSGINDSGYGLRQRDKKVIKDTYHQPEVTRKPRKRHHIVNYSFNDEDKVQCTYCPKVFPSKTGLWNHMRMHKVHNLMDLKKTESKTDSITFKCMLCKQTFDTNNELVSHKKDAHSNEEPFTCKPCKVAFVDHYDYLIHKLSHSTHLVYHCMECSKDFSTKTGFKMHLGKHFDKKIPCDICNKVFNDELSLKMHKNRHLNIPDPKTCGECGREFKDKKNIDYHMLTHTGVRPFQCLYCGKGFRNESARKIHTRVHTDERPHVCDKCHKAFRQSIDLFRHQEKHNDRDKLFVCQYCDKKFLHKESLKIHSRRHMMDNLFKCSYCDHTSTTRGNLRTHIIYKHTAESLHKCEICNVAFKVKRQLKRHLNSRLHRNNTYGAMKKGIIKSS